jgi:hypothetical protein
MCVRVHGAQLKQAVLAWVKQHLTNAGSITVRDTMVLDGITRAIGDTNTYIDVDFDSEKRG